MMKGGMGNLMKQAQQMQAKMQKAQEEIDVYAEESKCSEVICLNRIIIAIKNSTWDINAGKIKEQTEKRMMAWIYV